MDNNQFKIIVEAGVDIQKSHKNINEGIKSVSKSVNPIDIPFQFNLKDSGRLKTELEKIKADILGKQGQLIDFKINTSNVFDKDLGHKVENITGAILKYKNQLNEVITTELKWARIGSEVGADGKESAIMGWTQAASSYQQNIEKVIKTNEKLLEQEKRSAQTKDQLIAKMKLLNTQALKANIGLNTENQTNFNKAINTGDLKDAQNYLSLARLEFQQLNAVMSKGLPENAIENLNKKIFNMDTSITMLGNRFRTLGNAMPQGIDTRITDMKNQLVEINKTDNPEEKIKKYNALSEAVQKLNNEYKVLNQETRLNNKDDKLELNRANLLARIEAWVKNNGKAIHQFGDEIDDVTSKIQSADDVELKNLDKQFSTITKSAQSAGVAGKTFATQIKENIVQFARFMISATTLMSVLNGFRAIVNNVKTLDAAMTDLRKVTDETDVTYNAFLNRSANSAVRLGAAMSDIVKSTADFARLGYSLPDAEQLANVATVYKNVGDIDIGNATESIISTMKAFDINSNSALEIVDKFNEVGNRFAISSAGIGNALKRSAAALMEAGNTLDQSIALTVAANNVIQDPESVGTMWKTVSMRIRGATTELEQAGLETEYMAESTAKLRDDILGLTNINGSGGFDILTKSGDFKSTYDIILGIGQVWKDIKKNDPINSAALLELLAGKRQGNQLAAALNNLDDLQKSLATSMESSGSAMKENQKYLDSIAGKTDILTAKFQKLSNSTLDSGIVKGFIDLVGVLVTATDKIGLFNVVILATAAILSKGLYVEPLAINIGILTTKMGLSATSAGVLGKALSTMIPIAVIMAGIWAFDKLNVTIDEQKQKVEEANKTYEDSKSKLQSITKQLQENQDRIKELQKVTPLTFVEQGELEKLQAITKELLLQEDAAKKKLAREGRNAANEAVTQYNKQFGKQQYSQDKINEYAGYSTNQGITTVDDINASVRDNEVNRLLAVYKNLKKQKDNIANLYNGLSESEKSTFDTSRLTQYDEALQYINDTLSVDVLGDFENIKQSISNIPIEEQTKEQKETLKQISEAIKLIYKNLDPAKWNEINFDALWNSDKFSKAKDELIELSKSGQLNEKVLSGYTEFNQLMADTGLTASELVAYINSLTSAQENNDNKVKQTVQEYDALVKTTSTLESSFKTLSSAFKEQSENGRLSTSTILDLVAAGYAATFSVNEETGAVTINTEAYLALAKAKIQEQRASLELLKTSLVDKYAKEISNADEAAKSHINNAKAMYAEAKATNTTLKNTDAQILALNELEKNLGNVVQGNYAVANSAEEAARKLKQTYSSANSAINSLSSMVISMLKQRYQEADDAEKKYYQKRLDRQKEAMEADKKETEEFYDNKQDQIKAQLDLLKAQQATDNYQKNLGKKQDEASKIQAQIDALQFDTSEAGNKLRNQLKDQLNNTNSDIEDLQYDRKNELIEDTLNKELDRIEKIKKSELEEIEETYQKRIDSLEKQLQAVSDNAKTEADIRNEAFELINQGGQQLYNDLIAYNRTYGTMVDNDVRVQWDNAYKSLQVFGDGQINVLDTLNFLALKMNDFDIATQSAADSMSDLARQIEKVNDAKASSRDLGYYHSGSYTKSNPYVLSNNTIKPFSTGGVNDYTGLAMLHGTSAKSEVIFNASDASKLFNLVTNTSDLTSLIAGGILKNLGNFTSGLSAITNNSNINNAPSITVPIQIMGDATQDTIKKLENWGSKWAKQLEEKLYYDMNLATSKGF